jgi:hypothetical protein
MPIALVGLLPAWFILRQFTHVWIEKPISKSESIISGISAWIFLLSSLTWFAGIVLTSIDFFYTHEIEDVLALVFSLLFTGYVLNFYIHSRSELGLDDTYDFISEALHFRRSAQRRLDVLALIKQRQEQKSKTSSRTSQESLQRARLQVNLSEEKEIKHQLAVLKEGRVMDISETWHGHIKMHAPDTLFTKVWEVRIEPKRKRLSLRVDFPELNEEKLKDETTVLRLNREVYDFLQSLHTEPCLKHYTSFYESCYLVCRATKISEDGTEIFYPFMKVGVLVFELLKHENSYFNPRKLNEITTLVFNNGAQV